MAEFVVFSTNWGRGRSPALIEAFAERRIIEEAPFMSERERIVIV
jgi:hypothetical protein